jgi:hypothetical protein
MHSTWRWVLQGSRAHRPKGPGSSTTCCFAICLGARLHPSRPGAVWLPQSAMICCDAACLCRPAQGRAVLGAGRRAGVMSSALCVLWRASLLRPLWPPAPFKRTLLLPLRLRCKRYGLCRPRAGQGGTWRDGVLHKQLLPACVRGCSPLQCGRCQGCEGFPSARRPC